MAQTYYDPNLFKTDANAKTIYDIFKKYKMDNYGPDYLRNVKKDSWKFNILDKAVTIEPVFSTTDNNVKVQKFFPNPTKNWGPKARAKLLKYFNKLFKKY
jgi:hypothetical protein